MLVLPYLANQKLSINFFSLSVKCTNVPNQLPSWMSYGTAEEITLVKSAQTTKASAFLKYKMTLVIKARTPGRGLSSYAKLLPVWLWYPGFWHDPFYDFPQVVNMFKCRILLNVIGIKSRLRIWCNINSQIYRTKIWFKSELLPPPEPPVKQKWIGWPMAEEVHHAPNLKRSKYFGRWLLL